MSLRNQSLQIFLDAAFVAFDQFTNTPEARRSIRQMFAALERPGAARAGEGSRLPVCAQLDVALSIDTSYPSLTRLIDGFKGIEPMLEWRRRNKYDHTASDNFVDGHANAMIIGPGGLEERSAIPITTMRPRKSISCFPRESSSRGKGTGFRLVPADPSTMSPTSSMP